MNAWAIQLPFDRAHAAAALRLMADVEVCVSNDALWLRGASADQTLERALRALPAAGRFTVQDGLLTPIDARVPVGRLPDGPWSAIAAWFEPSPPPAALPGKLETQQSRVMIRLVASESPMPTSILLTSWQVFSAWVQTAPEVRLRAITFARADDGRTFIRGTPLPPISGRHFVETDGLAIPAGRALDPSIHPVAMLEMIRGQSDDFALLLEDASAVRIPRDMFSPASRALVRLLEARDAR